MKKILIVFFCLAVFYSCTSKKEDLKISDSVECDSDSSTYEDVVKPILTKNCYSCHGSGNSVKLTSYNFVKNYVDNGALIGTIKRQSGYSPMPPDRALNACDIDKIQDWVNKGALND